MHPFSSRSTQTQALLQAWHEEDDIMPELSDRKWQEGTEAQSTGHRGIGSYAAKLQAAKEQGLGTSPDQVPSISSILSLLLKEHQLGGVNEIVKVRNMIKRIA